MAQPERVLKKRLAASFYNSATGARHTALRGGGRDQDNMDARRYV
jgi:hypothetical protein